MGVGRLCRGKELGDTQFRQEFFGLGENSLGLRRCLGRGLGLGAGQGFHLREERLVRGLLPQAGENPSQKQGQYG